MKRKLRRSLYCIVCVLTLLSVSCIAAFADGPMYSVGIAPIDSYFVTGPSVLISQECLVDFGGDQSDRFLFNSTLQASLPSDTSYGMDNYYDGSGSFFYLSGENPRDGEVYSEFLYYDFVSNVTVDDNGYVYGEASCNFDYSCDSEDVDSWSRYITFTVRDFYCWPENQTDEGLRYPCEVSLDLGSSNSQLSFVGSRIYYSVNGSNEILEAHFSFDDLTAYDNLDFTVKPDYLPGVSPTDVVYIYLWDFSIYQSIGSSLNIEDGYLSYCFNPDVRKIDLNSARGFDSENPAVPLLDYTAWIGTAVSGFLDLQIFPYFTLGGVLMTLLAFTCVIWFLKLVAGG